MRKLFDVKGYFAAVKAHWLLFALTIVAVVVFFGAPVLAFYRMTREKVPGAAKVLPAK